MSKKPLLFLASIALLCSACATNKEPVIREEIVYVRPAEKVAEIPDGVVRYCWEEPMVREQQEGPGLDSQGHWYHPSYVSVREVRMGRWRPCEPYKGADTKGGAH